MSMQLAIDAATQHLLKTSNNNVDEGLVFVGNWHGTYPTTLIVDPSLTAVDVRVFLFICQHSQDIALGATAFPSYEIICKRLRISKPTLSNAMTRLRLTRWVGLVKSSIRDAQGKFRGQVIALSDAPMNLGDILELDADYMQLVKTTALQNQDKKTRYVAQGVLLGIEEQLAKGIDPLARPNPMVARAEAIASLDSLDSSFFGIVDAEGREKQKLHAEKTLLGKVDLADLSTGKEQKHPSKESLLGKNPGKESLPRMNKPSKESLLGSQTIDFIEEKNSLLGALSTSTSISISTSTGNNNFSNKNPSTNPNQNLEWHPQVLTLEDDHKNQLAALLAKQEANNQQILLDALAYRYESIQLRGASPLKAGPLPYIKSLIARLNSNQLKPVKPVGSQSPNSNSPAKPKRQDISHKFFKSEQLTQNALSTAQTKERIARITKELGLRIS